MPMHGDNCVEAAATPAPTTLPGALPCKSKNRRSPLIDEYVRAYPPHVVILDDSAYRHYNHRDREVDGQSQNRQFEEYQQRQASGFSAVNNNGDRGDPACASSVDALDEIRRQLDDIERMIADFEMRSPGCKSDTILQELLTQLVLKLDGIETGGVQSVREARKQQVVRVHALSKRVEEAGQLSVVEAPGVGV